MKIGLVIIIAVTLLLTRDALGGTTILRGDFTEAEKTVWRAQIGVEKAALEKGLSDAKRRTLQGGVRNPVLFRVEKDGAVGYILGTVHNHIDWSQFPLGVKSCVSDAEKVAFEIDMKIDQAANFSAAGLQASTARTGAERLSRRISKKAWERLTKDLAPVKAEILDQLSPGEALYFYVTLRKPILGAASTCLDCEIFEEAGAAKKELLFLETTEDRVAAFASVKAKDLTATEFNEAFEKDPSELVREELRIELRGSEVYKTGDLGRLYELALKDTPRELKQTMFTDRNRRWIPKLEIAIASGKTFVAVGAGHLPGDDGLVNLLGKDGYKVERVSTCAW